MARCVRQTIAMVMAWLVATTTAGMGLVEAPTAVAQGSGTVNSAMIWQPTLADTGIALAELLNQIDFRCSVDVDTVQQASGAASEGPVYALTVSWTCPPDSGAGEEGVWLSQIVWRPSLAETGEALAEVVNQVDAACSLDVSPVAASNGAAPDGPVYALAVYWACPVGAGQPDAPVWLSTMVWRPTLTEVGEALAQTLNEIPADCFVHVDPMVATNGAGPEGPVYAFAINWSCGSQVASSDTSAGGIAVTARDFGFDPSQVAIAPEQETLVTVTNVGESPHTFTIDEAGLSLDLAPGGSQSVNLTMLTGTYTFYCAIPGHRELGMSGTLIVQ